MKLKKFIIAFIFSMVLAVSSMEGRSTYGVNRPAIIYQISQSPKYSTRKKPLKAPRFAARNEI